MIGDTSVPLSSRLPVLVAECERRSMRMPFVISISCINRSVVAVQTDGGSPLDFSLICGAVQPQGYCLPAVVTIVDKGGVALVARLNASGGWDLLAVPGAPGRPL